MTHHLFKSYTTFKSNSKINMLEDFSKWKCLR